MIVSGAGCQQQLPILSQVSLWNRLVAPTRNAPGLHNPNKGVNCLHACAFIRAEWLGHMQHKERSLIHQSALRRRLPPSCLSHSASQFGTFQKWAPEEVVRYQLNNPCHPNRHYQPGCTSTTLLCFVWNSTSSNLCGGQANDTFKGCYQKKTDKAFKPPTSNTWQMFTIQVTQKKVFKTVGKFLERGS